MNTYMDWYNELIAIHRKYDQEFSNMTLKQFNFKIEQTSWSIGEIIAHLIRTNSLYFSVFDNVLKNTKGGHWMSKVPGVPNLLGNMILKSVEPSRKKKMKTVQAFEPEDSQIDDGLWSQFNSCQDEIAAYIPKFNQDQLKVIISSPANQAIVYPLHKALDIIVTHEQRHFSQAMEVKSMFPA